MTARDLSATVHQLERPSSRSKWILIALCTLLSNCAPTRCIVGVDEPDLAEIESGVHRSAVEKILGKRLWHAGVSDGLSYDIYQYRAEQPARPVLGVFLLGVDFLSLGALELGEHPRDMRPAKQVAVAYDSQNQVVFVSEPWPVVARGPCRRQRRLIPEDSGVPSSTRPHPLDGLNGTTLNSVIIDDNDLDIETIDGHVPEEDVIKLPPGHHEVKHHGISATVEFFPGRHYRVEHEHFYAYANYDPFYFIEDLDSGETMLCKEP